MCLRRLDLDPIASPEQPAEFTAAYDASTHQILITAGCPLETTRQSRMFEPATIAPIATTMSAANDRVLLNAATPGGDEPIRARAAMRNHRWPHSNPVLRGSARRVAPYVRPIKSYKTMAEYFRTAYLRHHLDARAADPARLPRSGKRADRLSASWAN